MRTYKLASPKDDLVLRTLLRTNEMPSWAAMSTEREPSYFDGIDQFGHDWAVIARDEDNVIGMYACSAHAVYCNGIACELGYLGALRVNPTFRHRLRILKEGYDSIQQLSPVEVPFWYTAIAAGNAPARRILEANLPGMPHYRYINDLVTLALPRSRGRRLGFWREVNRAEMSATCDLHNRLAKRYHFTPVLTPEMIEKSKVPFYVVEHNGEVLATMALWNQQAYKQTVARGYRQPLTSLLPVWNCYARMAKRVQLPKVGIPLDQTYLAFFTVAEVMEHTTVDLIRDALALCPSKVLTFGLHSNHPQLKPISGTFSPYEYRTRIYMVSFGEPYPLDCGFAQPEVAVL